MKTLDSKLPQEGRALRFDPDLAAALERMLEPHTGKTLERAQAAILKLRGTGLSGSFADLVSKYQKAVDSATAAKS